MIAASFRAAGGDPKATDEVLASKRAAVSARELIDHKRRRDLVTAWIGQAVDWTRQFSHPTTIGPDRACNEVLMDIPTRFACFGCRVAGWTWRRDSLTQNCRVCYQPMRRIGAQSMAAPAAGNNPAWEHMRLLADEVEADRAAQRAAIVALFAQIKRLPPGLHQNMMLAPLLPDQLGVKDGPNWTP